MSESYNKKDLEHRMEGAVSALKHELSGLRTGRASANLLDSVMVQAYGSLVPINQVANVSVAEPRMLSVSVWDKSMVGAVERAIRESRLNLNPITDGTLLRVPLPELNEERRKELVKIANQYAENARIAVRHVRRDGLDILKKQEKAGNISKDECFQYSEEVQKLTDKVILKIDEITEEKEKEIMHI